MIVEIKIYFKIMCIIPYLIFVIWFWCDWNILYPKRVICDKIEFATKQNGVLCLAVEHGTSDVDQLVAGRGRGHYEGGWAPSRWWPRGGVRWREEWSAKGHLSARRISWLVGRPADIMLGCKGELPPDAQKYSGEHWHTFPIVIQVMQVIQVTANVPALNLHSW